MEEEEEGEWGEAWREDADELCRHDDDPGDPVPGAVSEDNTDVQISNNSAFITSCMDKNYQHTVYCCIQQP